MKKINITLGSKTDIGNVKQVNQDCFLCRTGNISENNFGLFVVCDGLGGLEHGEIASRKTVENFEQWWNTEVKNIITNNNEKMIKESLERVIVKSNEELIKITSELNSKLGTTVSALFILNNEFYIVHVGDSRIYTIDNTMNQLTEDHTQYEMLKKQGIKNLEHVKKNVLTQCIGVNEHLDIYYRKGKLKKSTTFIICSDGFYNKMDTQRVISLLKNKNNKTDLNHICEKLIEDVKLKKERDNITLLAIDVKLSNKIENKKIKKRNKLLKLLVLLMIIGGLGIAYLKKSEIYKDNKSVNNQQQINSNVENETELLLKKAEEYIKQGNEVEAIDALEKAQKFDISNEELLIQILKIANNIKSNEYDYCDYFLYNYISSNGGMANELPEKIRNIIDNRREIPQIPNMNIPPGKYIGNIELKILNEDEVKLGHDYYYTKDGSEPTIESNKYESEYGIYISENTTLKIKGFNKYGDSTETKKFVYRIENNQILINQVESLKEECYEISNDKKNNITEDIQKEVNYTLEEVEILLNEDFIRYEEIKELKYKLEQIKKELFKLS